MDRKLTFETKSKFPFFLSFTQRIVLNSETVACMITFFLNHRHRHWGGGVVLWYLAIELMGTRHACWRQIRETDLEKANNRCHHSPLLFSKPQMTKQGNVKIELFCFTKDFNGSSKRILLSKTLHRLHRKINKIF